MEADPAQAPLEEKEASHAGLIEGRLIAKGRAIRSGKSISYAEAGVLNAAGNLIAHGTSTLMVLSNKGLKMKAVKFMDAAE